MKNIIALSLFIFSLTILTGCEAGRGFGKDMENSGKNIQETIEKNN